MTQLYRPTMTPAEEAEWRNWQEHSVIVPTRKQMIEQYIREHPADRDGDIARIFGCSRQLVNGYRRTMPR